MERQRQKCFALSPHRGARRNAYLTRYSNIFELTFRNRIINLFNIVAMKLISMYLVNDNSHLILNALSN